MTYLRNLWRQVLSWACRPGQIALSGMDIDVPDEEGDKALYREDERPFLRRRKSSRVR